MNLMIEVVSYGVLSTKPRLAKGETMSAGTLDPGPHRSPQPGPDGGGTPDLIQGNVIGNGKPGGFGIFTFVPYNAVTVQGNARLRKGRLERFSLVII